MPACEEGGRSLGIPSVPKIREVEKEEGEEVETESDEEGSESEWERGEKSIMQYASSQKILLVGEGDFSFALCLARAFETAYNMVATSLDSLEMLGKKYSNGVENVRELEERGCIVLHGVDATQMSQHYFLSTQRFDRVVYNFPHVGFMFPEDSVCQIKLNKQLVKGFLMNAKLLLVNPAGEVHVSHKEGQPYSQWDLVKKAAKPGLFFIRRCPFVGLTTLVTPTNVLMDTMLITLFHCFLLPPSYFTSTILLIEIPISRNGLRF